MIRKCGIGALVNTNIRSNGQVVFGAMPGVARRLVTFLASPRKVTKRRRPEVRRPAKARGTLRYSKRQAAAELGLVDALVQKVLFGARPQTVLADDPCRSCVTRRLSSGPGRYITNVALAVAVPRLTLKHLDSRLRRND